MKQKQNCLETGFDSMRIEVDIASYISDQTGLPNSIKKQRNSVVALNLKRQIKQESRFINLLCNNLVKSRRPAKTPAKKTSLSIPIFDAASESSCMSPFQNTMLRTMQTPISLSINKYPSSPSTRGSASDRLKSKTRFSTPGNPSIKLKKKRVFISQHKYEPLRINLIKKLQKRSLHSEIPEFRMFDPQEIMNITNGSFDLKSKPKSKY